jgi:hypothetical protein
VLSIHGVERMGKVMTVMCDLHQIQLSVKADTDPDTEPTAMFCFRTGEKSGPQIIRFKQAFEASFSVQHFQLIGKAVPEDSTVTLFMGDGKPLRFCTAVLGGTRDSSSRYAKRVPNTKLYRANCVDSAVKVSTEIPCLCFSYSSLVFFRLLLFGSSLLQR